MSTESMVGTLLNLMIIHRGRLDSSQDSNTQRVVTLGNFDGVHLGHQALLREAAQTARTLGLPLIAVTFDPHPMELLRPEVPFYRISSRQDQFDLMQDLEVDEVYLKTFSRAFSRLSVDEFLQDFLLQELGARGLVVGHDFRFASDRAGTLEHLEAWAKTQSMAFKVVEPLKLEEDSSTRPVSSSWIRERLVAGDVRGAGDLLGRRFSLSGIVSRGAGRGRTIGFPTANLRPGFHSPLKNGVYAGYLDLKSKPTESFAAVANFGRAPTFGATELEPLLEVHVLDRDFGQSLYGEDVCFQFEQLLRPEMKFPSPDLLVQQIQNDVALARQILGSGRKRGEEP